MFEKTLLEIKKSRYIVKTILILLITFWSLTTPQWQRCIITSPDTDTYRHGIGVQYFLIRIMLLFNILWDIFSKQVPQAIA